MERPAPSKSDLDRVTMFLLYLAQVIRDIPGVQEQRQTLYKHCRHHHFSATKPQNQ